MQEQPMQSHLLDIFWYSEKLVNLMYMLHWLILEKKLLITSNSTTEQEIPEPSPSSDSSTTPCPLQNLSTFFSI